MSIMYRINATVLGSKNAESDAGKVVGKQIKPGEANAGEEQAGKEKEQEEGSVTNSMAMLTAIPEVDLGMECVSIYHIMLHTFT